MKFLKGCLVALLIVPMGAFLANSSLAEERLTLLGESGDRTFYLDNESRQGNHFQILIYNSTLEVVVSNPWYSVACAERRIFTAEPTYGSYGEMDGFARGSEVDFESGSMLDLAMKKVCRSMGALGY